MTDIDGWGVGAHGDIEMFGLNHILHLARAKGANGDAAAMAQAVIDDPCFACGPQLFPNAWLAA